jgi:hypothetical protein
VPVVDTGVPVVRDCAAVVGMPVVCPGTRRIFEP